MTNLQLRKAHRYIGLFTAFWLVLLAITGIAVNHTHHLGLDRVYIENPVILALYGVSAPDIERHFELSDIAVSQLNQQVYVQQSALATPFEPLLGAVKLDQFLVLATVESLSLLTTDGVMIDQIMSDAVPGGSFKRIGLSDNQVAVETPTGIHTTDADFLQWDAFGGSVQWYASQPIPDLRRSALLQQYQGRELSVERLMLDVHSGRFFGLLSVWALDLIGLAVLIMGGSGVWIWWRGYRRTRQRKRALRSSR